MRLKKQKTLIVVLAVLFVLLIALYFIVIRPIISQGTDDSVSLDLLPGESKITDKLTTFYIFEPIARNSILSIEVENEYGGYTLSRTNAESILKASDPEKVTPGDFTLEGYAGLPFDDNQLASLIVSAGTPIAMMRVAENLGDNPEKLHEYGLDNPQASWTLTKIDGTKYTMYVGDLLVTEGGYYVKYADRDAVYIASTTLADTILAPRHALLAPKLITGLSDSNYYMLASVTLFEGENPKVAMKRVDTGNDETLSVVLTYPRPENNTSTSLYQLNEDVYFDVIYSFIDLAGESVVCMLPTNEDLITYGLDNPAYTLVLTYGSAELDIFVSEMTEDGYYYATSSVYSYSTIVKISASVFEWMTYDEFKWIEKMPFYVDIKSVSELTVKGENGNDVDLDFVLTHGEDEEGYATLEVLEKISGKQFKGDDVQNFRKYYLTLMNITNQEYVSMSDEDKAALTSDDSKLVMTMTYKNTSGYVYEYKFYKYYEASTGQLSGGKIYVVVNGVGEFYTTNDLIDKSLSDAYRVMNGLDIDSYGHN